MLPVALLEIVDRLTRVDPVRTYPARAGALVAELCGADAFTCAVDIEGVARATSVKLDGERTQVALPLRCGRQTLGQLVLFLPEGKPRLEAHDLRTARWAARLMGRCLSYALRMRHDTTKKGIDGVSDALHKAPLTPRERDVVALLISGASTREIASEAHLTVGTVHTYLKRIYPKLGVRSRLELVVRMIGTDGIVVDDDGGHHDRLHAPTQSGPDEVMN